MAHPVKPAAEQQPPAGAALGFAGCLYVSMLGAAVFWLWQSERLGKLPQAALGRHGIWAAAGAGLAAGLAGAAGLSVASRRSKRLRACEARIVAVLGALGEGPIVALSLLSAVAEEVFFRLAVQDALGLPVAVALYVVLNTGPGFWSWAPIALLSGLLFGCLVQTGFGLLAATAAHAVINYLSLRRILPS